MTTLEYEYLKPKFTEYELDQISNATELLRSIRTNNRFSTLIKPFITEVDKEAYYEFDKNEDTTQTIKKFLEAAKNKLYKITLSSDTKSVTSYIFIYDIINANNHVCAICAPTIPGQDDNYRMVKVQDAIFGIKSTFMNFNKITLEETTSHALLEEIENYCKNMLEYRKCNM